MIASTLIIYQQVYQYTPTLQPEEHTRVQGGATPPLCAFLDGRKAVLWIVDQLTATRSTTVRCGVGSQRHPSGGGTGLVQVRVASCRRYPRPSRSRHSPLTTITCHRAGGGLVSLLALLSPLSLHMIYEAQPLRGPTGPPRFLIRGATELQMLLLLLLISHTRPIITIIIMEGLSLLQSIPLTTANKKTQAQKKGEHG